MAPQRRFGIYIGYSSLSIIRFLEPLTSDLFTVRFANCHFDNANFSSLGTPKASKEDKQKNVKIFSLRENDLSYLDPCISECDNDVQYIIICKQLPTNFLIPLMMRLRLQSLISSCKYSNSDSYS